MVRDPRVEFQAFIRWLALNPELVRSYRRDPEAVLAGARLSEPVRAVLAAAGTETILACLKEMADSIFEAPESWTPGTFTRDPSATGYGRKPAAAE